MSLVPVKNEECAFCGKRDELTRDHVPPKSIFAKPRPSDLITVPCCRACNRQWSTDDEYFQLAMKIGINGKRFPAENASSLRTIQHLLRPQSQGYARHLIGSVGPNRGEMTFQRRRLGTTLHRIVRGLFYYQTSTRLPEEVPFRFWLIEELLAQGSGIEEYLRQLVAERRAIANGAFRYALTRPTPGVPFATIALLEFYDHRQFLCITDGEALLNHAAVVEGETTLSRR